MAVEVEAADAEAGEMATATVRHVTLVAARATASILARRAIAARLEVVEASVARSLLAAAVAYSVALAVGAVGKVVWSVPAAALMPSPARWLRQ